MFPFRGNTSGIVDSVALNLPTVINSFGIVNKTAATIGVNVYMINGASLVCVSPLNLQLAAGEMYEGTREIVMLATEKIRVHTSGSTDYDFTISNLEP